MKVIPVIDILNGIVVHAVRGQRREYQPLKSTLCKSVEPLEVAKAFRTLGFCELYVADLDGITKGNINYELLKRIVDVTGLKLMVDAGLSDIETAKKLIDTGISKVVIGTETLQRKSFVCEVVRFFGTDRIVVSLDLKNGKLLVKLGFDGCADPLCLLREFKEMDVSNVIILDLARVGSCEGVNANFLSKALKEKLNVFVGGGVRDLRDLVHLKNLGAKGVLVATALHSNAISVFDLKQSGLL